MGRNWAIVVGINTYDNLLPLKYAQLDAEAMATWFKEAKFEQVFVFTENSPSIGQVGIHSVTTPIPTQPIYARFQRALDVLFENPLLNPEDNFWFFFAGHGRRYADKDYLMFLDSNPKAVDITAISVDYVTQRLRRSGAGNVVLFLDACRNEGSGSRSGKLELGIGEERHQGVITFYSCKANQEAYEIDELQHGSFTQALLEGLRIAGEGNCATVERLDRYLRTKVPAINQIYRKPLQHPYVSAEPATKLHLILLPDYATLNDINQLKLDAREAEDEKDWELAEQLWMRVNVAARGSDPDVKKAWIRIVNKQGISSAYPIPEPFTSSSGGRSVSNELLAQKQEEHRQNLVKYQQAFSRAIEQEYPLSPASRKKLTILQQSLQLTNEEVVKIEQPIFTQKRAEHSQLQEQERIRQQQEAEYQQKLRQYEQKFIQAVEQEFPLNKTSRRQLKNLQESLQLPDKEVSQIEQPIIAQKEAEYKQQQEIIRQQQEAEKQRQEEAVRLKQEEAEKNRQREEGEYNQSNLPPITRRKFLKWAGLGGAGLVTAVVGRQIFNGLLTVEFETVTVNKNGKIITRNSDKQAKLFKQDLGNNVTLEMVAIPSGKFMMGSPLEEGKDDEKPQHEVTVKSFFMGKHPVTQAQWRKVAALPKVNRDLKPEPSNFKGDNRPVERVSWYDAVEFCSRLSKYTNREYRLPSEAEWEYACRAGTTSPFYFGETITTELANYNGNQTYASEPKGTYREQTTKVGIFPPNDFGLYDLHGNVWEWCQDDWHSDYEGAPADGTAWFDDKNQLYQKQRRAVLRGGSWIDSPNFCRSASRVIDGRAERDSLDLDIGFRVVCAFGRILP